MLYQAFLILFTLTGSFAANCGSNSGRINSKCVSYYHNQGCSGEIGSYKPTCAGNCFQYDSFSSIAVAGDGYFGTMCTAYSDTNCQNSMGGTGNQGEGVSCTNFLGAC